MNEELKVMQPLNIKNHDPSLYILKQMHLDLQKSG